MSNHFIESFKIYKLWGYRDINLTFNSDVNVLIGPNGSGKTTVLNLLHSILSLNCHFILDAGFDRAEINLKDFEDSSIRTVEVDIADKLLKFKLDEEEQDINTITAANRRILTAYPVSERDRIAQRRLPRHVARGRIVTEEFYDELTGLVPIAWLPVSRSHRVLGTEYEEERHTKTEPLESVDLRIEELLEDISRYHSILNAQLSERYKKFERQVLSAILWDSKDQDSLTSATFSLPSKQINTDKKQLLGAFEDAGLLDEQMQNKIDGHFTKAEEVAKIVRNNPNDLTPMDILAVPLIGRTQAMVKYAGELEEDREHIFALLRHYEEAVNSFLDDKFVEVDDSGDLKIKSSSGPNLDWHFLSSGEKQILILLTEALLRVDEPVVYIADEPELSLHVTWQEKLLESLVTLGGQKQIIVATHSPDIVGKYQDKVIDLGRES